MWLCLAQTLELERALKITGANSFLYWKEYPELEKRSELATNFGLVSSEHTEMNPGASVCPPCSFDEGE